MAVLSFKHKTTNQVCIWTGDPHCQAAHDSILSWLKTICKVFAKPAKLSTRIKGNLGESVGFFLGYQTEFKEYRAFAANALVPFEDISRPDLDIVWVLFGESEANDVIALQEVKTTGQADLAYADALVEDYQKLYGSDPQTTLHSRLQTVKNKLEYEHLDIELARRLGRLEAECGQGPKTAKKILLYPTLVHELTGTDPLKKMVAVRTSIIGLGWNSSNVSGWAVGLTDLDKRLFRLAHGKR